MLYKNEELFKLEMHPEEIKKIEKYFHGKFPVKVVYPAERIVKSKLKHNLLPDKPNSISFDLKATVKTPNGTEVWRYAENVIVDEKGYKKYTPKKFLFSGAKFLTRNDIELIFFLLNKSEYCKDGKNQGPMVKFMFEDLVTEAEKKVEKKKIEAKIDGLLYGEDFGLSDDKLKAVLKAYQEPGVDDLTPSQIRIVLGNRIHETKEGPDEFFRMVNSEEEIKTRVSITKAMDMGVLRHDALKNIWFWQAAGEKGTTQICKVPPTKSASEALYDYYLGNQEFRDDLQAVLITKNPNAGKKGKKEEVLEEKEE